MLISQGFNPETGDLAIIVNHCDWSKTTDNIAVAKFSDSDEESDTKSYKKRSKLKEPEENSKKCSKRKSTLYFSLHGSNKSHTSRESKVLKARTKDKYKPRNEKKDYRKKFKELKLLEREAAHQRTNYLKYKNLNKTFTNRKTLKDDTIIIYNTSDSNSLSSSEDYIPPDEYEKTSIAYTSECTDNYESSKRSINNEETV